MQKILFQTFMFLSVAFVTVTTLYAKPGGLDPSFGNGGLVDVNLGGYLYPQASIARQSDGKILATGVLRSSTSSDDFVVSRYNTDGSADTTFGINGKLVIDFGGHDTTSSIAIQSDGKIVVAGNTLPISGGYYRFAIVRLNNNSTLDTTFGNSGKVVSNPSGNSSGSDVLSDMKIQPDGKILVVGTTSGSGITGLLARYNPNGTLDQTFNPIYSKVDFGVLSSYGTVTFSGGGNFSIQSDGKIVVATRDGIIRYNSNGGLDTNFGNGGKAPIGDNFIPSNLVIQRDGKIAVIGAEPNQLSRNMSLRHFNANGTLNTSFGNNGTTTIDFGTAYCGSFGNDVIVQTDGKIIGMGSTFTCPHGTPPFDPADFALARFNLNGTLDTSFGTSGKVTTDFGNSQDSAQSIVNLSTKNDGRIVVGGRNSSKGNFAMARYFANTCGNNIKEAGEQCDGTVGLCPFSTTCNKACVCSK